jgi:hypothetical protein
LKSIERMESVGQRIEAAVDLMAKVFKHHEAFLTDWLDRFKAICEAPDAVQTLESEEQECPEKGR